MEKNICDIKLLEMILINRNQSKNESNGTHFYNTRKTSQNNQLLQSKWNPLHQGGLWIAPHYHQVNIWSYIPIYIWLGEHEEYPQYSKSSSMLKRQF